MKTITIKTMLKNTGCYLSVVCLLIIASCNVEVKNGDAGAVDSNMESGISIQVVDKLDSVDKENVKELKQMPDTAVERINRMADSTRTVLKDKKKELQKQVEQ